MLDIAGALDDLADTLTAAGVPAAVDPGAVPVPGAWVTARELALTTLAGGGALTCHVWLVVADMEDREALLALTTLLDRALGVLAVDTTNGDTVQLATTLVLPGTGTPLPAFQITTTLDL